MNKLLYFNPLKMREAIIVIVAGILAAPKVFSGRSKAADDFIKEKIAPWQGYIGVLLFIWGLYGIYYTVTSLSYVFGDMLWGVTYLGIAILELLLGILLGWNLLIKQARKHPEAARKAEAVYKKLVPWQTTLGIAAVAAGVWFIIYIYVL